MAGQTVPQGRLLLYQLMREVRVLEVTRVPLLGLTADTARGAVPFASFDARASLLGLARGGLAAERDGVWALGRLQAQGAFLTRASEDPMAAEVVGALGSAQRHLALWHRRLGIAGSRGALAKTAAVATAAEVGMATASGLLKVRQGGGRRRTWRTPRRDAWPPPRRHRALSRSAPVPLPGLLSPDDAPSCVSPCRSWPGTARWVRGAPRTWRSTWTT